MRADSIFFMSTLGLGQHSLDVSLQLCAMLWCTHTHTRTHTYPCTWRYEPNPAPSLPSSPPLVFDVVFGEPCLKKFFCSFEVAQCFPLSFGDVSSFIFWLCVRVGRETDQYGTWYLPHICYLPCVVPVNLRCFSNSSYCFLCDMGTSPISCQNTAVAFDKELLFKQTPQEQACIKHCLWGKQHFATSGMLTQICRVSLWLHALQRHKYFKAFICSSKTYISTHSYCIKVIHQTTQCWKLSLQMCKNKHWHTTRCFFSLTVFHSGQQPVRHLNK